MEFGQLSTFETVALWLTLGSAIVGIVYGLLLRKQILREDPGTEKMQQVGQQIQEGASAYLNRQFKTIIALVVVLFVALTASGWMAGSEELPGWMLGLGRGVSFLLGCFASGFTGFMGMNLAVRGNVRCAAAARTSRFFSRNFPIRPSEKVRYPARRLAATAGVRLSRPAPAPACRNFLRVVPPSECFIVPPSATSMRVNQPHRRTSRRRRQLP